MSLVQPRFEVPSSGVIACECFKIYMEEKVKLKDYLLQKKPRVSLSTDTWTSIQGINYLCVTAHFIDDTWTLKRKVLNFFPISSSKGMHVGMEIEKCLIEWGIEKVFTITLDNGSSNDDTVLYLKENIMKWGHSIMKCQFFHMGCVGHIINLLAADGLKYVESAVGKIREAVHLIKQSPLKMRTFKECCEEEMIQDKHILCLDVSTKWDSTYLMLKTAQKFETAFKRFERKDPYFRSDLEDREGVPETKDWKNVRTMIMILNHFYDLTLKVSDSNLSATSNVFFNENYAICRFLDEYKKSDDDEELASMACKMKERYDQHWGDPMKMDQLLYIAVVLDPRFKFDWVQFALSTMYTHAIVERLGMHIKEVLISLYNEYKEVVSPPTQLERKPLYDSYRDFDDDNGPAVKFKGLLDIDDQMFKEKCYSGKKEVDRYLDEEVEA